MPGTLVLRRRTWMANEFSRESIAIKGWVAVVVVHVTFPGPPVLQFMSWFGLN